MRVTVIGQEVRAALDVERAARCPRSKRPGLEQCFESGPLCQWQSDVARRGFIGAELVRSIYGWTLRYDSGLQNFGIIASGPRDKERGWTYERVMSAARHWQAEDVERRYVTVQESELKAA